MVPKGDDSVDHRCRLGRATDRRPNHLDAEQAEPAG
jgi:hypothetical protein